MSVHQDIRIPARPLRGFGKVIPILTIQQRRCDVKFLQLSAFAEKFTRLCGKILIAHRIQMDCVGRVDNPV